MVRSCGADGLDSSLVTIHDPESPTGPVRTCIGCRGKVTKRELLRIVAGDGTVVPDPGGSAAGRGAHLHPTVACFELAVRKRVFSRALRYAGGSGGALDLTQLEQYLARPVRDLPR